METRMSKSYFLSNVIKNYGPHLAIQKFNPYKADEKKTRKQWSDFKILFKCQAFSYDAKIFVRVLDVKILRYAVISINLIV